MPIFYPLNIASSLVASAMRGGVGVMTSPASRQPEQLLELYDFEGCPHCRLVREVLTELDLDALILPCPKGGRRFRADVIERGGKAQFPYLVDPNTEVEMYESADIIRYLFNTYAGRSVPLHWQLVELQRVSSMLAAIPRIGLGVSARPSRAPQKPLELYSFEASPFARPVRDVLCELEIPYVLRSVGRVQAADWVPPMMRRSMGAPVEAKTRNRKALQNRTSVVSIPYLIDPNNDTELAESEDIIDYLNRTYGA